MDPIFPMEPASSESVPESDEWIAQIKWDGVRILTYFDNGAVRLFNRKKRERTLHYPEIVNIQGYCSAKSVILDGEVISLGENGKPAFNEVMKRDGIRRLDRINMVRKIVPVTYMVFDVLFLNGEWIHNKPLLDRLNLLSEIIMPNEHIQCVSSGNDGGSLFRAVKEHGMEGIVMKQIDSPYLPGKKKDYWLKIKNYRDIIAVIGGFTLRNNIVNAILLGLYDDSGRLIYVGHTGTGKMTVQDWKDLTEVLRPSIVSNQPFANQPERHAQSVFVRPEITVKIKFAEWTDAGYMRQPSIEGFIEVPPAECMLPHYQ
ncbi:non-homologous end-joining DNA ligase [Bacillus sp. T33-2]|uniref:non-homologous end-joining DNA ligase n=1 Tax=Bacillus sp. T33-2 TaxID=2054168 RepID=UPI000C75AEBB|nr:non-homologous end-joining DNA ligase [Bacillus sp. T33-2]PLR98733.1 DNA ligase [Bacillus sp. T33-2]